jgi:hypothetical protein
MKGIPWMDFPMAKRFRPSDGQTGSNCCKQAITLRTPVTGSVSEMGILRHPLRRHSGNLVKNSTADRPPIISAAP